LTLRQLRRRKRAVLDLNLAFELKLTKILARLFIKLFRD
jgi:hypothetical protein